MNMKKYLINLSKSLILIPSTKANLSMLKKVLNAALKEVKEYTIEYFEKNQIPSALVYAGKTRPKKFKVILNGHLDVVEAKEEQYKPYEKNGRLYGRGAYDMKASAAVEILVFKELAKKLRYPLALQLVTDEETGGFCGTKYQIDRGVRGEFVIAGENTNLKLNNEAKGIVWADIEFKGKASHGAYPWQGKNAIAAANQFIDKLYKHFPIPKKAVWQTTVNVAKITTTNQTYNKVPDNCVVGLDVRYIPKDSKTIVSKLQKIVAKTGQLKLKLKEPSQFTEAKNPYIIKLQDVTKSIIGKKAPTVKLHGGSDIRHYDRVGVSGVCFGAEGAGHHTDNEWVSIKSLENYYQILKKFLQSV